MRAKGGYRAAAILSGIKEGSSFGLNRKYLRATVFSSNILHYLLFSIENGSGVYQVYRGENYLEDGPQRVEAVRKWLRDLLGKSENSEARAQGNHQVRGVVAPEAAGVVIAAVGLFMVLPVVLKIAAIVIAAVIGMGKAGLFKEHKKRSNDRPELAEDKNEHPADQFRTRVSNFYLYLRYFFTQSSLKFAFGNFSTLSR